MNEVTIIRRRRALQSVVDAQRAKGVSLNAWADAADVSESAVRGFLSGRTRSLTGDTYDRLAEAAGVPLTDLLGETVRRMVPLVGYVGAGAVVHYTENDPSTERVDDVEAPPNADEQTVAVIITGDSMFPRYYDNEIIYFKRSETIVPSDLFGKDVVVRLADGRTLVKVLRRGSEPSLFNLESFNAPPIEDVAIEWAVPVLWVKRL
ncbi:MAG: XRE family transcriptional regulator [Inquilinus sp.]|uniref:XRE family transcriptional regulator n=1 Tax=Inquilinus sp. TaxID=1932117 RepID=UPI003F3B7137